MACNEPAVWVVLNDRIGNDRQEPNQRRDPSELTSLSGITLSSDGSRDPISHQNRRLDREPSPRPRTPIMSGGGRGAIFRMGRLDLATTP
jgi:hypothetical protein